MKVKTKKQFFKFNPLGKESLIEIYWIFITLMLKKQLFIAFEVLIMYIEKFLKFY